MQQTEFGFSSNGISLYQMSLYYANGQSDTLCAPLSHP